jgi:ketosteroid isomerase-like protein
VTRIAILGLVLSVVAAVPLGGQTPATTPPATPPPAVTPAPAPAGDDALHNELRALRDGLMKATNEANLDAMLTFLHPNVVVTWQNAEVSRGHAGVRAYVTRLTRGEGKKVEKFTTNPTVDELTILYGGNTGIAFGALNDHFQLTDGMNFELSGRWSATVVRENGRWLVASFHASTNVFDNAVLALAGRTMRWVAAGAFAGGVLLAFLIGFIQRRRQRA